MSGLEIDVESGLTMEGKPFLVVSIDGEPRAQMDPAEMRTMALHWLEAAEGAEMDAMVFAELGDLGLDINTRGAFIASLRRRRDPR